MSEPSISYSYLLTWYFLINALRLFNSLFKSYKIIFTINEMFSSGLRKFFLVNLNNETWTFKLFNKFQVLIIGYFKVSKKFNLENSFRKLFFLNNNGKNFS